MPTPLPPPGSSDEISIPPAWQSPGPDPLGGGHSASARAEEALGDALRERCGGATPRWADVLALVRGLWHPRR